MLHCLVLPAVSSWIQNGNDPHLTLAKQWSNNGDSQLAPAPAGGTGANPACGRLQADTYLLPGALSQRLRLTRASLSRGGAWWITAPTWCRAM